MCSYLLTALYVGKIFIDYERITLCIMGWLNKIFKGSSHSITEGHSHRNYGEDPHCYAPSTSGVIKRIPSFSYLSCSRISLILYAWVRLSSLIVLVDATLI